VEIVKNIEPVGMVSCDPVQIQQIIFNLFNNAMDAMKGKGIITVGLRKLDASEMQSPHNVLLKISDNGKGMKKEVLNRVFDPFFTTKGVGEGTGLGLSTVLGIVKRHNAIIKIDSQAGKGTAIMILFVSQ
jgi:signal transduction histidine kinase